MSKDGISGLKLRIYYASFIMILLGLIAAPLFFYKSKVTKNPDEFRQQDKQYLTMEVKLESVSPSIADLVSADDYQVDHNGEENVRIISVLKKEPNVMCKASYDEGKTFVDFVTERKDIWLLLKVRYNRFGDTLIMYPTTNDLMLGKSYGIIFTNSAKTKKYQVDAQIIKVNKP